MDAELYFKDVLVGEIDLHMDEADFPWYVGRINVLTEESELLSYMAMLQQQLKDSGRVDHTLIAEPFYSRYADCEDWKVVFSDGEEQELVWSPQFGADGRISWR